MKYVVIAITIILFSTVAIKMKKNIKVSEIYTTILYGTVASSLVDLYASFRFKAWGFFKVKDAEFTALLIIFGIYPAATAMIINWYPYKSVWWKKFCYLMGWSIFSTFYEWITLKFGILWHEHWNLYYSFALYPIIYYTLIVHVRVYRWIQELD